MYTLKVFNSFFGGSSIIKIDEIRNIEIEEFMDSFDLLNVEVDYYTDEENNLNCSGLREFQRIQIIETGLQDKIIFDGFIYELQPTFKTVKIVARDYKGLLDKKVLFSNKNYSSQTLDYILNDILTDLNNRSSGDANPEDWLYSIDADVTGITKSFDKGTTYFAMLNEIGVSAGKNWKVESGTIVMADIIGTDKTTGDEFTELIYNKDGPDENNIGDISVNRFWSLVNTVLTSSTNVTDSPSIDTFGRLEEYNDISGTELTNHLETSSQSQRIHKFNVDFGSLNTVLQLWDKLVVEINSGIEFIDISGDLFITRRKVKILGGQVVVMSVDVWEITVKKTGLIKTINDLQGSVKKLQL